ncbi:conserved hypothetical protein [Anaeromyxobacter sp. K]|uniref:hypothetical protein n=1 Tax=Anaeromyxobacter sp. (strain K) TaxID=447217 RepID=UPI00015F8CF9|nr:hypothetical protein [Anaeromyxobacter sp. K]ACG72603.1 conserved hypothetical protein [Anaeromyxobacter sp. K]
MRRALSITLALLALAACAPRATIPDAERERISRALDGAQRYLRVAAYAGPLWGDTGKVFLSDAPPAEVDLVETPGGEPIAPPAAERVLPPGTPVRVEEIEVPTGWLISQRVVTTPRYHPWAYVKVAGDPRPHVIVLSQTAAGLEDVRGELERLLTADDPTAVFSALPPEHRQAVMRKEALEGMSARALEMAWGVPERKRIDRPAGTEEWSWAEGKRRAFLRDDRVERLSRQR